MVGSWMAFEQFLTVHQVQKRYRAPEYEAYSIIFDEDNDALIFHLGHEAPFKEKKSLFLRVEHASKMKANLDLDGLTPGYVL